MSDKTPFYLTQAFAERLRFHEENRQSQKKVESDSREDWINRLRAISLELEDPARTFPENILCPGWDWIEANDCTQGKLIREAAGAINNDLPPDEGVWISRKAVAALLHYVADMYDE
jgi:hypothetical protein